ncbi:MAG: nucleoside 2-deoxyribosyltransferase [Rhizobiaceae bacterium]|nr:nucleoside 2-deoxyribosyltransferase [Rhizobiaceae bacterium]
MTAIDVVGGIYRERCAFPYWNELYGSAGRAAKALSGLGPQVRLHSALSQRERIVADASFGGAGISLHLSDRGSPIEFEYLHSLAVPTILPLHGIGVQGLPDVVGDVAIKFGMLDADPKVTAEIAVYDPQSAFQPRPFGASGLKAKRLAVIANRGEMLKLARASSLEEAVRSVLASEGAEVVVVKDGIDGAIVYDRDGAQRVPAYKTKNVFSLGSGDVFVAAFCYAWAICGDAAANAAEFASQSTANYVETRTLPIAPPSASNVKLRDAVTKAGGKIYLAAPFREAGQRMLLDDARSQLQHLGMQVFSPIHDIGPGSAELVVQQDLAAIRQCDAVFAILNGSSPGTVFEVGYARALDKPVFCVTQNMRDVDLKLPTGAGAHLHEDYVSALFQIAWRS